jgi:NAD(P)-dependent dehydrogenase (short-subunit alcohol dehydrogenase family)
MVANAGIGIMVPIAEMTLVDWQRQQAINLDGVFLSIKHAIPALKKQGGGSIVLMSSIAGLRGAPGLAAYSATKGGVRLLAKSVALEHAEDNIRCNSVHPGIIAARARCRRGAAAARRRGPGHRQRRAVPVQRGCKLHDRPGAGDRRRHDRRWTAGSPHVTISWELRVPGGVFAS